MKRLSFILAILVAISVVPYISSAFILGVDRQEASVDVEQVVSFEFIVTSETNDRFSVHTDGLKPWMTIEDVGSVSAGIPRTFHLYASPSYMVGSGTYGITVQVQSESSNETQEKKIFITVLKSIFASVDRIYVSGTLQPAGYADIKINIKNLDVTTMKSIDIVATVRSPAGIMEIFNQTIDQIEPMETKVVQRIISIPSGAEAGKYSVQVSAYYNGKIFNQKSQEFEIIPIAVIRKDYDDKAVFIGSEKTISVTNHGNIDAYNIDVENPVNGLEGNFFFQIRGPQVRISDGVATWTISKISPGETVSIKYQINYLPLLIIVIIALIALWFVLFNVRVIEIRKKVVKKSDDDITVHIEIRNRTGKDVDSVVIKDTIPLIFRVKAFMGLSPVRKRDEEGFALIWRIRKLSAAEERIFSYRIVPVIKVAGTMRLPKAKIMYKNMRTLFVIKSNSPLLGWL